MKQLGCMDKRVGSCGFAQGQQKGTILMHHKEIPPADEAVRVYGRKGRVLTDSHSFGEDPLGGNPQLKEVRDRDFQHPHSS